MANVMRPGDGLIGRIDSVVQISAICVRRGVGRDKNFGGCSFSPAKQKPALQVEHLRNRANSASYSGFEMGGPHTPVVVAPRVVSKQFAAVCDTHVLLMCNDMLLDQFNVDVNNENGVQLWRIIDQL